MSAWMLSVKHISTISNQLPEVEKDAAFKVLWSTNRKAIGARYGVEAMKEIATKGTRDSSAGSYLSPVEIIKACQCYDYQACEVKNYRLTKASQLTRRILNGQVSNLPGYSAAAWSL